MLQAFRTHKRWMMFIAMIFIIPSFVVTGIYSYNRMSDSENDLATVGDTSITMMDFDNAKRQYLDNFRRQTKVSSPICLIRLRHVLLFWPP